MLERYLERARVGIEAYYRMARPLIDSPGWKERDPPGVYTSCDTACDALASVQEAISRGVCIIGPGRVEASALSRCPVIAGPAPAVIAASMAGKRLAYTTSDLDSTPLLEHLSMHAAIRVFVHVHGDNHYRLSTAGGQGRIVYTCQECSPRLLPAGGFTDGDRAVLLAMALEAPWIRVYGFTRRLEAWHKEYPLAKGWKLEAATGIIEWAAVRLGYSLRRMGWVLELTGV